MNALATEQNALRKIMRESMPQDIGTPDLGKSLDIVNRGYIGGLLGGFPDMANLLLNTFVPGYDVEVPVGGSEWWGQKMQDAGMVSDKRYPAEELLAGLGNPIPAGIFAGKGAKLADMAKLLMAEGMLAKGDDAADVWRATGWGKGPDGKWRFEIPDNESRLNLTHQGRGDFVEGHGKLGGFVDHQRLYDQYPDIKETYAGALQGNIQESGYYNGNGKHAYGEFFPQLSVEGKSVKSPLLHELQHAIQEREGFARGGSPDLERLLAQKELPALEAELDLIQPMLRTAQGDEYEKLLAKRFDILGKIEDYHSIVRGENSFDNYKRLAGEAESRLTQARMNLTPEERLLSYPWDADYFEQMTGVPIDRLIYRDVSPDVADSRGMVNLKDVPGFGQDINIGYEKNPTKSELKRYLQEKSMEYKEKGWRDEKPLRYIVDDKIGDAYFFDANDLMHQDMADALGISKLDQGFVGSPFQVDIMFNDPYFDTYKGWKQSISKNQRKR